MTTIELRTSIAAELDQMSVESDDAIAAGLSPRVLQFQRGNPWYATDKEVDILRQEYLTEKYKWLQQAVHIAYH